MKVLREGHLYELENFENKDSEGQKIQFIEKVQVNSTGLGVVTNKLVTVNDGTTNEEVLEVLINRLQVLTEKLPSRETSIAITKLEEALLWLNKRTSDRLKRGVEGTHLK